MNCSDRHASSSHLRVPEPENAVMGVVLPPWDEIVSAHLRCLWALCKKDFEEACACQIFAEVKEENWMLPVVLTSAVDLRTFATALDTSTTGKVEPKSTYGGHMERVAQLIMKLFQICAADSRTAIEDSKKRGMMGLANQLFKIYFQINKLNLCKSIIRAIENMNMDSHFSLAQRVTFNYYVGRKAMFDGEFQLANTALTFAFERCLSSSKRNKRMVLIYLIPVRMLLVGYLLVLSEFSLYVI
ncbi:unnamed protein product [Dibothriocephalus latus]|uniref:PCI domain-containing protein n=1 Tax=Dibothriocephalus latus TaxID=60516 RepID=A0A3P7MRN1_DIBLA|nr:unnamed protein product [Dibothriocephalus latus]